MELPIKKAIIDVEDSEMGLKTVSLVSDPAIQINWIKFNKQSEIKLAIQNEDKRIIFTPVLIPNQLIYRNIAGEEFNLMFDKETIELVEQKWVKDNLSSAVDIEHSSKLIDGVTFFESVLLNNERFATAKGFEGLPEGTWFLTGKVESDDVWTKIKSGEVNGVSIDGLFKTAQVNKVTMSDETVIKIINNLKTLNVI
jgi:hypothetical protein